MKKVLHTLLFSVMYIVLMNSLLAQSPGRIQYVSALDAPMYNQKIMEEIAANDFFQISNVQTTGVFGNAASLGEFSDGQIALGIDSGFIVGNATIQNFVGGNTATGVGGALGIPGSANLNILNDPEIATFDASLIQFDFIPTKEKLSLDFVFASEEYCDFVGSLFADRMGIFLAGPGISGPFNINGQEAINLSEFVNAFGVVSHVGINTINHAINSSFYVDNNTAVTTASTQCSSIDVSNNQFTQLVQFDGWTVPLSASYDNLQIGGSYTIQIAVADGADRLFGSAVFIGGASFNAGEADVTLTADAGPDQSFTCIDSVLTLGTDNTSMGPEYEYTWTNNSGTIISTEPFLEVTENSSYILTVTNTLTNESVSDAVSVGTTFEFIGLSVTSLGDVTCENSSTSLEVFTELFYFETTSTLWETTDGNIVSDPTQNTIEVNQPGTYTVVVTNLSSGCTGTESIEVLSDSEVPLASATVSNILSCVQAEALLEGSTDITNATFDWRGPDAFSSNSQSVFVNVSGAYTLTVTNLSSGCESSTTVEVLEDTTIPVAEIMGETVLTCDNSEVTLFALEGFTYTFEWSFNGLFVGNGSSINVGEPGEYVLIVTDINNGCTANASVLVEEDRLTPEISFLTPNGTQIDCNVMTVTLVAAFSSPANGMFEWFGPNNELMGTETSLNVTECGTYTLLLTDLDNQCVATEMIDVACFFDLPIVQINEPDILNPNEIIKLDAIGSSSGSGFLYNWTTTDGNIVGGASILTPQIDQPGTYCLTVLNYFNNCEVSACVEVLQSTTSNLVADAGLNQVLNCEINSVQLGTENTSQGANICYTWTGPNGFSSNLLQPTTFEGGEYVLTVTDKSTGETATDNVVVGVDSDSPSAIITQPGILDCTITQVTLDGSGSSAGSNFDYEWMDENGVQIGTTSEISVAVCGAYILVVTNTQNGCTSSASAEVACDIDVPQAIIVEPDLLEQGQSIQLDASASSTGLNIGHIWETVNGNIVSGGSTLTPTVDQVGTYCLFLVNLINGCEIRSCVEVRENSGSTVVADAGFDQSFDCFSTQLTLDGSGSSIGSEFSYSWTDGNGNEISTEIMVTVSEPGVYTLTVTNSQSGEVASDTIQIFDDREDPLALVEFTNNGVINCNNTTVLLEGFTDIGTEAAFVWTDAAGTIISDINQLEVNDCGLYVLTVTDITNGCTSQESVAILCDNEAPTAIINTPGDLESGQSIMLDATASSSGIEFLYTWATVNGNIVSGENSLTPTVDLAGDYCLLIEGENGCAAEACVEVRENSGSTVVADAGPDQVINCISSTLFPLDGSNSSMGPEFEYVWTNSNGDVISTDIIVEVTIPDAYTLTVTNTLTGESASDTVMFLQDLVVPSIDVATPMELTCAVSMVELDLTTDLDPSISEIMWEGPGIVSDPTLEDITVNQPGVYVVTVGDINNGCISILEVLVLADIEEGVLIVDDQGQMSCEFTRILDPSDALGSIGVMEGSWNEQQGLTVDTFPLAIVDQSGTYTFTAINATNGCNIDIIYTVLIPPMIMVDAGSDQTISCLGDGVVLDATVPFGSVSLTYEWFTLDGTAIGNTASITVTSAGTYAVEVTDSGTGCIFTDEVVVTEETNLLMADVQSTDVSCFGASDGSITIVAMGGEPPYTFSTSTPMQTNLPAGSYTVTITDDANCSIISTVEISEPEALSVEFIITSDGDLLADITGGTEEYAFTWNTGQDSLLIEDPTMGTEYILSVTDANGCQLEESIFFQIDAVGGVQATELNVYPNPTHDFVIITQDNISTAVNDIRILDVQGRTMAYSFIVQDRNNIKLEMQSLQAGIYFIQAIIDEQLFYQKIVVQ